jgi:hypothetical protein
MEELSRVISEPKLWSSANGAPCCGAVGKQPPSLPNHPSHPEPRQLHIKLTYRHPWVEVEHKFGLVDFCYSSLCT